MKADTQNVCNLVLLVKKLMALVSDLDQIFLPPYICQYTLDPALKSKTSAYLAVILGWRQTEIAAQLPGDMPLWGKMRHRPGGDMIRTTFAFRQTRHLKQRNNTRIRVSHIYLLRAIT